MEIMLNFSKWSSLRPKDKMLLYNEEAPPNGINEDCLLRWIAFTEHLQVL